MTDWAIDPPPHIGELGTALASLAGPGETFAVVGGADLDKLTWNGAKAPTQAEVEAAITALRAKPPAAPAPTLEEVFKAVVAKTKGEPDADQKIAAIEAKFEAVKVDASAEAITP